MTDRDIVIEFGNSGYKAMMKEMVDRASEKPLYVGSEFLMQKIRFKMIQLGYSQNTIGRAIFEDALDYQTKFAVENILQRAKMTGKVSKTILFKISVPKRE